MKTTSPRLEAINSQLNDFNLPADTNVELNNLPVIPEYSDEDYLNNRKFREFLDAVYEYNGAEYNKEIKRFLTARLCSYLTKRDMAQKKSAGRNRLRDHLFGDYLFKKMLKNARGNLGIKQKSPSTIYKDTESAYEDLLFQMSLNRNETKKFNDDDFSKEFLDYKKAGTDKEFDRRHQILGRFMVSIDREVNGILRMFSLDYGWRGFVMASIASPTKLQDKIPFSRVLPSDFPIIITDATPNEVTIKIRSGATKGDFSGLYEVCKPIFAQPILAETLDDYLLTIRPLAEDTNCPYRATIQDLARMTSGDDYSLSEEDRIKKMYRYKRSQ